MLEKTNTPKKCTITVIEVFLSINFALKMPFRIKKNSQQP
jgi:hypothetical protein